MTISRSIHVAADGIISFFLMADLQNRNRVTGVENKHGYGGGKGQRDKLGDWDGHIRTTIYKIGN